MKSCPACKSERVSPAVGEFRYWTECRECGHRWDFQPKNFCLNLWRLRLIYVRGDVIQIGPWRDGGCMSKFHRAYGLILIRWWSFGRLFIEWLIPVNSPPSEEERQ